MDGGGSVHTRTFERALAWALRGPRGHALAEFHLACDGASGDQAEVVARRFVAAGVDVVVGHYASGAAARAAPVYERAGIPLLLPAASAPALTSRKTTFRLCPSDDAILARALAHVAQVARKEAWRGIVVESDPEDSARALANAAREAIARAGGPRVDVGTASADALFYIGRHHAAIERLRKLGPGLPANLILSDDCVHPEMARELAALRRTALAFGMQAPSDDLPPDGPSASCVRDYLAAYRELPGVYFLETCAAVEIALALACAASAQASAVQTLAARPWPTVLGLVQFARQENIHARTATWRLDAQGMRLDSAGPQSPPH